MTTSLRDSLEAAEQRLDTAAQGRIAELIDTAVAAWSRDDDFTEAEKAHLRTVDSEPFDPADPNQAQATFDRARG